MRAPVKWLAALALLGVSETAAAGTPVPYATGFDGIELAAFGPGGAFGHDLYVGTAGTDTTFGGIYRVTAGGVVTRTDLWDRNAISIAFDTQGVLGGGMFFSYQGPDFASGGAIYHVTPDGTGGFSTEIFADFSRVRTVSIPGST